MLHLKIFLRYWIILYISRISLCVTSPLRSAIILFIFFSFIVHLSYYFHALSFLRLCESITLCNCMCSSSFCFSASATRNIEGFGARTYLTGHERANTIHGFADYFRSLKHTTVIRIRRHLSNFPFRPKWYNKARTVCWCKQATHFKQFSNTSNCM